MLTTVMVAWCFFAALCDAITFTKLCPLFSSPLGPDHAYAPHSERQSEEKRTYHSLEVGPEIKRLLDARSLLVQGPPPLCHRQQARAQMFDIGALCKLGLRGYYREESEGVRCMWW